MRIPKKYSRNQFTVLLSCLLITFFETTAFSQQKSIINTEEVIPIAKVWSGHPVGFNLLTTKRYQYVCFYDTNRVMTIAQRLLTSKNWKMMKLPSVTGWDSHNYITMIIDQEGYIHLAGNMHNVPLIYFRSQQPENIETMVKLPMTGRNENSVTYPYFFTNTNGDLYFQYRNGKSGTGTTFWNKYDTRSKTWSNPLGTALFDGEGEASAYISSLKKGPDGYFYLPWMWRLTVIANTCHNLCLMRSKDLVNWENVHGEKLILPVKWHTNQAVVDPVGPWNGLINVAFGINWDKAKRPFINYHKYDRNGKSQLFLSRLENNNWQIKQVTDFKDYTWNINLGGSLRPGLMTRSISNLSNGNILLGYNHEKYGSGQVELDSKTLHILSNKIIRPSTAKGGGSEPEAMITHQVYNGGYILEWQTLPHNRDAPISKPYPSPTLLVVKKIIKDH